MRICGRKLLERLGANGVLEPFYVCLCLLRLRFVFELRKVDALPLAPLLQEAEALLKAIVRLLQRTSVRMSLLVLAKIAVQKASFREGAALTAPVAVVEDALDEKWLVHAAAVLQKPGVERDGDWLRNPSGRC